MVVLKLETFAVSLPVLLKRVPLSSLREEFLIPGRKFVFGWNCGGKAVNENA